MAVACIGLADFDHTIVQQQTLVLLDAVAVGCGIEVEADEEDEGCKEYKERTRDRKSVV